MQNLILRTNPQLRASTLETLLRYLDSNKDHDIALTAKRYREPRSLDQNAALFAVAYPPLREHTGYQVAEIHEWMCGERWGWVDYDLFGRKQQKPRRTTTTDEQGRRAVLSKGEFADFYRFVQMKGAEAGVLIPDPDPFWREAREAA